MARNGSGTYSRVAGTPYVYNTVIDQVVVNAEMDDIATALTNSLAKNGETTPTANLPMGGFKLTGLAAGAANGDSLRYEQVVGVYAALAGSVSQAFSAASLEVGHASDTTITRVSAGTVAVEGVNLLTTTTGAALAGSASQAFSVSSLTMLQGNSGALAVGEWSRSANYGTYYKAPSGVVADMAFVSNDGATVWRLQSDGVFVATPTLLGYTTGAGGAVTQATSKTTAVTLNKPCGQITMNNAALAGGAAATFLLNNSLISAVDVVNVTANWGGAIYRAQVYYTTAGQCAIQVTNTTGGSLSDAVVLNFAIIKGAIA